MASGSTTEEMMLPLQAAINCHWHSPQRGLRSRVSLHDGMMKEGSNLVQENTAWVSLGTHGCVTSRHAHFMALPTPPPSSCILSAPFCGILWALEGVIEKSFLGLSTHQLLLGTLTSFFQQFHRLHTPWLLWPPTRGLEPIKQSFPCQKSFPISSLIIILSFRISVFSIQ